MNLGILLRAQQHSIRYAASASLAVQKDFLLIKNLFLAFTLQKLKKRFTTIFIPSALSWAYSHDNIFHLQQFFLSLSKNFFVYRNQPKRMLKNNS
jgi:hypothetical protein